MAAAQIPFFFFLLLSSALVLSITFAATIPEPGKVGFSYLGSTGPTKWGSLRPDYSKCSTGKLQSPINIVEHEVILNKNLKPLTRDYNPAKATLVDNGFNIGMRYEDNVGVLDMDGKNYTLKQMHWHSPSEHRINGQQFPAELHLVHFADNGSVSVVAILFQYGNADPLISKIESKLYTLAKDARAGDEEAHIPTGTINTKHMRQRTRKYYRYIGSFTTPPCTENVTWNILGKIRSISEEQVAALKAPLNWAFKNNSRPLQSLNGRHVELYDELKYN